MTPSTRLSTYLGLAPSDETWRQVVAAVLARKPIGEVQEKERI
jgi:hypothetical protein